MATSAECSASSDTATDDATLEGFKPRGMFTCRHGEADKVPPHDTDKDTIWDDEEKRKYIEQCYAEATRRLPLAEMTQLVDCIRTGGHCIGVADPISNIILNSIYRLPWPAPRPKRTRWSAASPMEAALTIAAQRAGHAAPEEIARIMTARYPPDELSSIVAKLQGDELLTTADVWAIRELLSGQGAPLSDVKLNFLSRPGGPYSCNSDNNTHDGKLELSSDLGNGFYAKVIIQKLPPAQLIDQKYISDLTFDSTSMEAKLSNCLADTGNPSSAVDYDAFPCEHIVSLKMCLLDAIHAMYIKALAILPSSVGKSPFIRAILVAGHCYGPLDPVSNIILNSVWYKMRFPWHCDINRQGGILDTSAMSRVESHSIDGLVAILVSFNNSSPSCTISRHRALEYLYFWNCDLTSLFKGRACNTIPFGIAARAAKHPQCGALESFLMSLSDEKLNHISSLLQAPCGTKL
ncbi:hypothetical protein QOZ80_6BG0489290 [Eleusine coracana subsp. coracana]|nr:hypothetical protein QOZ80_6BG0489290 [Eleusine coracana subsp. coracana]